MANLLSDAKKQQVIALGQLGWTLRRIEAATGVRRETAGAYLKAAGVSVRPPGRWGHPPANPAKEVSTDPTTPAASPSAARACRNRGGIAEVVVVVGSPGWARTSDFLINSQALYQLSYRGVSEGNGLIIIRAGPPA